MTTYTYLQKLGMHETDMDSVQKCIDSGIPHFKKRGKYWLTKHGIPMMCPDAWADLGGTVKIAPLPRGIEAVEQTTDKRVVV